ncbi:hypothetical protein [Bombiscardovia coagulans]|uniref:hypothetical protein n=1 Tax=Bombiscardovia coagulans TaxID=686666 RepID=UPI000B9B2D28|nr:hypothetical protein [Bombiscardovia coagulans]
MAVKIRFLLILAMICYTAWMATMILHEFFDKKSTKLLLVERWSRSIGIVILIDLITVAWILA